MRVLYIAGSGRSGSTLLGGLLGSVDGLVHVGELRQVWRRGIAEDWLCGCGRPFSGCPLWQPVLGEARAGGAPPAGAAQEVALVAEGATLRVRQVPLLLAARWWPALLRGRVRRYQPLLAPLYRAVARQTGAGVIVDSSKNPSYGWVLSSLPGFDVRVVHLVRDPRGTAYSWGRRRVRTDATAGREMDRFGPVKSTALWTLWNGVTELLWSGSDRYLRLRYEDLVAQPEQSLRRVCELLGLDKPDLAFVQGGQAELATSHTVSGNPGRMASGTVLLRPDLEWQRGMSRRDRRVVSALAGPHLRRYGYSLRAGPG